jgi:hypothetical protein
MSIIDTVYRVAHAYPGGIPALAVRMGISKHVLQNKVNPNNDTHKLNVEEAAAIADLADCDDIAKAFAERRNMVCIPIASHEGGSDMELLDLFLAEGKEKGEWNDVVKTALSDGRVDPGEFARINKEFMDYCAAGAELMSRLSSMVQDRRKTVRAK